MLLWEKSAYGEEKDRFPDQALKKRRAEVFFPVLKVFAATVEIMIAVVGFR